MTIEWVMERRMNYLLDKVLELTKTEEPKPTNEDRLKEARAIVRHANKEESRLSHKRLKLKTPQDKAFIDDIVEYHINNKEKAKKTVYYLQKLERGEEVKSYDISRLKQAPILEIVKRYGIKVVNSSPRRAFISLRNERTPSCCLYLDGNNFHDFGSGDFGDVIDIVG